MRQRTKRTLWVTTAVAVLVAPVGLTVGQLGVGKLLGTVLIAVGVLSLVAMAVTVGSLSRLRSVTAAFGIDRLVGAHKWLGIVATAAALVHMVLAIVRSPKLINPFTVSTSIQWGYLATAAMVVVGLVAAWGRRSGTHYELWYRVHVLLAGAALVLAALHVIWLGDLLTDPVLGPMTIVIALGLLAALFLRWVWRPLFSRHGAYVIYGVRPESPSVATLVLAPVHLRRGLRFHAGQFVWLRLRRSVLGSQEHPFTIASSAQITGRLELTVRGSGDFSETLAALPTGTKVWLDGPHGSFSADVDDAGADGLVLLAGGVGITPMMSMLRTLADRGDVRSHHLVLAQRPDEPLFGDELASLAARLDLRVVHLEGRRVDAALLGDVLPAHRHRLDYFVCGPPSLLAGSLAALEQLGIPSERVHTEQFGWSGPVPTADPGRASTGPAHARPR